jgi:elongation factor Tu
VTGRVERGVLKMDEVEIVGLEGHPQDGRDRHRNVPQAARQGEAGDNVGVLLRGTKKEDVERGMVLAKPGSIKPHKKFKAEVYVLSKDEGGRHTPFFNELPPAVLFPHLGRDGHVNLPDRRRNGDAG